MTWKRVFENPRRRAEIYVVDFADPENRAFFEGRAHSFKSWIDRSSLISARRTIEEFSGDNTRLVIVEIDRDLEQFRIHTADGVVISRSFEDSNP